MYATKEWRLLKIEFRSVGLMDIFCVLFICNNSDIQESIGSYLTLKLNSG